MMGDSDKNQDVQVSTVTEPSAVNTSEPIEKRGNSFDSLTDTYTTILKEAFSYCEISQDETAMNVNVTIDGVAELAALAAIGDAKAKENWESVIKSTVSMSSDIVSGYRAIGYTDYVVSFYVLNDKNHDNILVMTLNDSVVYNAVE